MKTLISIATLALIALGCGGTPAKTAPQNQLQAAFAGAPAWVLGCDSYFEGKAVICGVGSVSGTKNPGLAVSAAEGRGRTKIARSLQVQVKAMLKDYQSTTTGGEAFGEASNDEQHIVDVSKQITKISLSGTKKKNTWIGPDGTMHVLMVLDVETFEDSIKKMSQLDDRVRKAVVARAKKAFSELDAEMEKQ